MQSETESSWFRSRTFKLLAPVAGAAALLIVANLLSSPGAGGRPESQSHSFLDEVPFGDRIEKTVGPQVERTAELAGTTWDIGNDYWQAALKGFQKDPDGELDK